MGYRSDVAIKIYGNKAKLQQVKDFADAELEIMSDDSIKAVASLTASSEGMLDRYLWDFDEDDASFFLVVNCVKWYDGYPAVDYFNAIFKKATEVGAATTNTANDADHVLYGEFVRIGEDLDDNEERRFNTNGDDQITITRAIDY